MNTTDIRQAILMAADKIERFPGQFRFSALCVPTDPKGCGCALGWIGYFANAAKDRCVSRVSEGVLGIGSNEFYTRMENMRFPGEDWMIRASDCAACLRRYADAHHPAEPEPDCLDAYMAGMENRVGGSA